MLKCNNLQLKNKCYTLNYYKLMKERQIDEVRMREIVPWSLYKHCKKNIHIFDVPRMPKVIFE